MRNFIYFTFISYTSHLILYRNKKIILRHFSVLKRRRVENFLVPLYILFMLGRRGTYLLHENFSSLMLPLYFSSFSLKSTEKFASLLNSGNVSLDFSSGFSFFSAESFLHRSTLKFCSLQKFSQIHLKFAFFLLHSKTIFFILSEECPESDYHSEI